MSVSSEDGLTKWNPARPDLAPQAASQAASTAEPQGQGQSVADAALATADEVFASLPQEKSVDGSNLQLEPLTPFGFWTDATNGDAGLPPWAGYSMLEPTLPFGEMATLESLNSGIGQFKSHWDWLSP